MKVDLNLPTQLRDCHHDFQLVHQPLEMDDPVAEIPYVIALLTETPPSLQQAAVTKYFTPDASFTHPFCRTASFQGSRLLIHSIFSWYKIMSPIITAEVKGVAYD